MKLPVIIILIILFGGGKNNFSQERWKWEELKHSFSENIYILSAASSNDFWVRNDKGDVIHYRSGKSIRHKTIIPSQQSRLLFESITESNFIAAAMDNQWQNHFYTFNKGVWKKDTLVFRLPIQNFLKVNDNLIYAIGNFGTMLKYSDSRWIEIKTPLKSHINYIDMVSPDEIYLLTKSEGVFRFNGFDFQNIPFEEANKWDITNIKAFGKGNIFVIDGKRKIYKLVNGKFIQDHENKSVFGNVEKTAYYEIVLKTDHHSYLPMQIPAQLRFSNNKSYHKDSILFSAAGGAVYKASVSRENYFSNLNKVFNIKSNDFTFNQIAAIIDLNNDGLQDIMTVNRSTRSSFTFFYNDPKNLFRTEILPPFEIDVNLGPSAAYFDFNNDYYIDFVIITSDTGGISLSVYENNKAGSFFKRKSISLNFDDNLHPPLNLKPVDIDGNGKLDLCITYYYGPMDKPGYEIIVKNSLLNELGEIDTSYKGITKGWNTQSLFADLNNNGINEWIIANKWRKSKLLVRHGDLIIDEAEKRIPNLSLSECAGISAADFDNDGNLDLLTLSDQNFITLYKNNGRGYFNDVTTEFGLNQFNTVDSILSYVSTALGDFNNDGYTDIFISHLHPVNRKNLLLINVDGKYFVDKTGEMQITSPVLHYSVAADIDNDGDIDIFSFGANDYALWINNLNDNNFIKIKPNGVISNSDGWGAKVWIYESGHINEHDFLRGYKQIGTEIFGYSSSKGYIAHFGVDSSKLYDVKIKFYGGKEKILYKLKPGMTYSVDELGGLFAFLYKLPGITLMVLKSNEIQLYIVTTLIAFFSLYFGTRNGLKKYKWDTSLLLGFVSTSITLYWLLIILTNNSNLFFTKYVLPLSAAIMGIMIPNLVFYWITRNHGKTKSVEILKDELFFELLQFSHGEWALSNLNSLQLLFENPPDNLTGSRYIETLNERYKTFIEMVVPRLNVIINLSAAIGIKDELVQQWKHSLNLLIRIKDWQNTGFYTELAGGVIKIKDSLSSLKRYVYINYSCNPVEVIKNTCSSLNNIIEEHSVQVSRNKYYDGEKGVLIRNYELADVLDNCIRNSIKALIGNEQKEIEIRVYRVAPKICIDVIDNGYGLNENEFEKVFESGYSGKASTGYGLFNSREVLKKYGGRIFVKFSRQSEKTVFTIELNEGILN